MNFEIVYWLKIILKIFIVFTLIHFLAKNIKNYYLKIILFTTVINIILSDILISFNLSIAINNNIYIIVSFFLWIASLKKASSLNSTNYFIIGFLIFSIFNILFNENFDKLNTKTFVFGTLIYIILFLTVCFYNLKDEKLDFFLNNKFILISSPILFFIGYSIMFGFDNKIINNVKIHKEIKLFDIISNLVNFTYYSLINLYIYKERKQQKLNG